VHAPALRPRRDVDHLPLTSDSFKDSARLQSASKDHPALRQGEKSAGVALLQLSLAALDYPMPTTMARVTPDGIFGPETAATVAKFQTDQGLAVDGVAGHDTLARLDALFLARKTLPQPPFPRDTTPAPHGAGRRPRAAPPRVVATVAAVAAVVASMTPPAPRVADTAAAAAAAAEPAAEPAVVSPPSADWVEIGRSTYYNQGKNGKDKDLSNNDVEPGEGDPPWYMHFEYKVAQRLSDWQLEMIWRTAFDAIYDTGVLGQEMISRFMSGSGLAMMHPHGSDLSNTARNTLTFIKVENHVRDEIKRQLVAQLDAGAFDWRKLAVTVDIPFATAVRDLSVPLRFRAMIGGIHGTRLFARNFRFLRDGPAGRPWVASFDLKYEMGDHFGVGTDDMYSPDLIAMNILQHEREGHRPFLNYIYVEQTVYLLVR